MKQKFINVRNGFYNLFKSKARKERDKAKREELAAVKKVPLYSGKPIRKTNAAPMKDYKITCAITFKGSPVRAMEFTNKGYSSAHAVSKFEEGIGIKVVSAIQDKTQKTKRKNLLDELKDVEQQLEFAKELEKTKNKK